MSKFKIISMNRSTAFDFIRKHHRHHKPPQGYKCAIGCVYETQLIGVGIVGRPVSRHLDDGLTCEITRVAVMDHERSTNACSFLYGKLRRLGFAMGYSRIITYTLPSESGSSLKGAGYRLVGIRGGGTWDTPSRKRIDKHPTQQKLLWESIIR